MAQVAECCSTTSKQKQANKNAKEGAFWSSLNDNEDK
jgi:hypothetical protein